MTTRRRRARTLLLCSVAGALALTAACSSSSSSSPSSNANNGILYGGGSGTSSTASPSTSASAKTTGKCTYTASGTAARNVGTPPSTPVKATRWVLDLTLGSASTTQAVTVKLNPATTPCTVNSIDFLTTKKYYDDTRCHRLTTSGIYVLQCGDPTATGAGGPGYEFPDELSGSETYPAGTVAMANAGPGTNGSQFFLVYKDSQLPASYTVFGTITGGLPVVQKVAAAGSTDSNGAGDGAPKLATTITRAVVS